MDKLPRELWPYDDDDDELRNDILSFLSQHLIERKEKRLGRKLEESERDELFEGEKFPDEFYHADGKLGVPYLAACFKNHFSDERGLRLKEVSRAGYYRKRLPTALKEDAGCRISPKKNDQGQEFYYGEPPASACDHLSFDNKGLSLRDLPRPKYTQEQVGAHPTAALIQGLGRKFYKDMTELLGSPHRLCLALFQSYLELHYEEFRSPSLGSLDEPLDKEDGEASLLDTYISPDSRLNPDLSPSQVQSLSLLAAETVRQWEDQDCLLCVGVLNDDTDVKIAQDMGLASSSTIKQKKEKLQNALQSGFERSSLADIEEYAENASNVFLDIIFEYCKSRLERRSNI